MPADIPDSPDAQTFESGAISANTSSNISSNNNTSDVTGSTNIGAIIGSVCAAVIVFMAVALLVRWKWRHQQQHQQHKHLVDEIFAQAPAPVQNDGPRSSFSTMECSEQAGSDLQRSLIPPLAVDRRPTQPSIQVTDHVEQAPDS
ncbi:hypothetical protein HDU81_010679, partial [Chytriomyces hyalinus]